LYIPPNHPRYHSLVYREQLVKALRHGVVVLQGLIAHGRGECFDYLLGERTTETARKAIRAACAALLLAKNPVISVNGNTAALVPREIIELAHIVGAEIEVNLFYRSTEREYKIANYLRKHGAIKILGVGADADAVIAELFSERRRVSRRGIVRADVVLIPLEDGDRAEALKKMGKFIIAIDLNPLSRTARAADITIVDNIVRALPEMIDTCRKLSILSTSELKSILSSFSNEENLKQSVLEIWYNIFRLLNDRLTLTL